MLRKILIFISIFISIIQISNAQYGTIEGTVKDNDGNPIIGASVTIKGEKKGTYVGKYGHFIIRQVTPGFKELTIKAVGYECPNIKCLILKDSTTCIDVVLKEKKNNSGQVYVNPYQIGTIWIWDSNYYFK